MVSECRYVRQRSICAIQRAELWRYSALLTHNTLERDRQSTVGIMGGE